MNHPTDEELDALVGRMSKLADDMENHATYDWDEHEDVRATLNVITTLRTQLAEARAALDNANKIMDDWTTLHRVIADIRDASGIGSRLMLSELAHEIGKRIAAANARADLAEVQVQALVEALESIRKASLCSGSRETARAALARMKGGEA